MKLKICGMAYQENISEVAQLQPDYLGFIFYEKSSRFFKGTIPQLPHNIKKVGVFVDTSIEHIIEKVKIYKLQAVQLHGEESAEFCHELKRLVAINKDLADLEIIKVFSIKEDFNFDLLIPFETVCDFFLFDTKGNLPGGNGTTFNWEVLKGYPSSKPYFLSGGIGLEEVENINKFLQRQESQHCHVIDVNSKFELEPGLKDIEKLNEFKSQL